MLKSQKLYIEGISNHEYNKHCFNLFKNLYSEELQYRSVTSSEPQKFAFSETDKEGIWE